MATEVEVAEGADPVVDGDDDDVAALGQGPAVVLLLRAGPMAEPAAVHPEQHRAPAVESGREHVEEQAVLVLGAGGPVRRAHQRILGRDVAGFEGVDHVGPRRRRRGRAEPPLAHGWGGVSHAHEHKVALALAAAHGAMLCVDDEVGHDCLLERTG